MRGACGVFFSLFDSEGVKGDGLTLAFGILWIYGKNIRAASLKARDVEVRLVTLYPRNSDQTVAILSFKQKGLRKASIVAPGTLNLQGRRKKV